MIEGTVCQKTLPDGRILTVTPMTYGKGRITIGTDEETYYDAW